MPTKAGAVGGAVRRRCVEALERGLERLARQGLAQEVLAAGDEIGGAARRFVGRGIGLGSAIHGM